MNRITINDHHDDIPKKNHAHQINDPKKYHVLKAYNFDLVQIILIIMTILIRTTQYYIYDYLGQIIGSLWLPCLTWSCAKQTSALSESNWSKIHYDHQAPNDYYDQLPKPENDLHDYLLKKHHYNLGKIIKITIVTMMKYKDS